MENESVQEIILLYRGYCYNAYCYNEVCLYSTLPCVAAAFIANGLDGYRTERSSRNGVLVLYANIIRRPSLWVLLGAMMFTLPVGARALSSDAWCERTTTERSTTLMSSTCSYVHSTGTVLYRIPHQISFCNGGRMSKPNG